MTCARCGCGVFKAEDQIIMNKVWHKCCFRCNRCNKVLDKCSAKLFQGEIFCECCHAIVLEDFETLLRPCRVVSSPSCICIKRDSQFINKTPSFDYSKKYDICFPSEIKNNLTRNIQSCSCIPDVKNKAYCFAFPMPREVANYYNRTGMRRRNRYGSQKRHSNDDKSDHNQKNNDMQPTIRIRTITPPRKRGSPIRVRCPYPREESPQRGPQGYTCCSKYNCCPCNNCDAECPHYTLPLCENSVPSCSCRKCRCKERDGETRHPSPSRRTYSPPRKSPCRCFHCVETCGESTEVPEPIQHSSRSPRPRECLRECPRQKDRPHCERPCCPIERPHHPESPLRVPDCMCHKCSKDRSPSRKECACKECPRTCEDCPRSCKDCPRGCNESVRSRKDHAYACVDCPRGCNDCPRGCTDCPRICTDCPRVCKDCPRNCKDYPPLNQCSCCPYVVDAYPSRYKKHGKINSCRCDKPKKYCVCGKLSPCDCKMNQIKSECTSVCVRCGCKVYAAEKICVSSGSYHTSCFSCVCCHKLLDIKNVYENGGEIYCKHCYNNLMGNSYYGYT